MTASPLEQDTCRDFVLPRLKAAGWSADQIHEQFRITDGRVITVGKKHRRGDALRADYVLEHRPGVPIAVVEAKREYAIPGKGLQQAKRYAQLLDLTHNLQLPRLRSGLLASLEVPVVAEGTSAELVDRLDSLRDRVVTVAGKRQRQVDAANALVPAALNQVFGRG